MPRVLGIEVPSRWIFTNVLPCLAEFVFISNHAFEVISLPDFEQRPSKYYAGFLRHCRFERADNCRDRSSHRLTKYLGAPTLSP